MGLIGPLSHPVPPRDLLTVVSSLLRELGQPAPFGAPLVEESARDSCSLEMRVMIRRTTSTAVFPDGSGEVRLTVEETRESPVHGADQHLSTAELSGLPGDVTLHLSGDAELAAFALVGADEPITRVALALTRLQPPLIDAD